VTPAQCAAQTCPGGMLVAGVVNAPESRVCPPSLAVAVTRGVGNRKEARAVVGQGARGRRSPAAAREPAHRPPGLLGLWIKDYLSVL
jgi:hypothetical protein